MDIRRMARHLFMPSWWAHRIFPVRSLQAIEVVIHDSEMAHVGQIRFSVEGDLDFIRLLRGLTARDRAIELFSHLKIWDTEHNNGVLIYLLLADREVEIIVDRGLHKHLGARELEDICREMERAFGEGRFEAGVVEGIKEIGRHLARHYPRTDATMNELSNKPVVL